MRLAQWLATAGLRFEGDGARTANVALRPGAQVPLNEVPEANPPSPSSVDREAESGKLPSGWPSLQAALPLDELPGTHPPGGSRAVRVPLLGTLQASTIEWRRNSESVVRTREVPGCCGSDEASTPRCSVGIDDDRSDLPFRESTRAHSAAPELRAIDVVVVGPLVEAGICPRPLLVGAEIVRFDKAR